MVRLPGFAYGHGHGHAYDPDRNMRTRPKTRPHYAPANSIPSTNSPKPSAIIPPQRRTSGHTQRSSSSIARTLNANAEPTQHANPVSKTQVQKLSGPGIAVSSAK